MYKYALALVLFASSYVAAQAQDGSAIGIGWSFKEARQFDFWIGEWDVNLRTIQDDSSWVDSVAAVARVYRVLDGKAILELWDSKPIKGFSLRYFDPGKKQWILWLNWPGQNRSSFGKLEGSFRQGRGEFFSGLGTKTQSRYTFCDISPSSLRWDDGTSLDGGKTWTSNWIMEFSRTQENAPWPGPLDSTLTYDNGDRCDGKPYALLDNLAGYYRGNLGGSPKGQVVTMECHRVLDGCALMILMNVGGLRTFSMLCYNSSLGRYEELLLDNRSGTPATVYAGNLAEDGSLALSQTHSNQLASTRVWHLGSNDIHIEQGFSDLQSPSSYKRVDLYREPTPKPKLVKKAMTPKPLNLASAINTACPRSGKPVVASSLTEYRGRVVGFCNTHCRDDFAKDPQASERDRTFFDAIIDSQVSRK